MEKLAKLPHKFQVKLEMLDGELVAVTNLYGKENGRQVLASRDSKEDTLKSMRDLIATWMECEPEQVEMEVSE